MIGLVYGHARSGGALATALADAACGALPDAELEAMPLAAMARVTRIAEERLRVLAQTAPVFAIDAAAYVRMGAIDALWEGDLAQCLLASLARVGDGDNRARLGHERGGRSARPRRDRSRGSRCLTRRTRKPARGGATTSCGSAARMPTSPLTGTADADDRALVAGWVRAGRPFVVRCQADMRESPQRLAVGMPLCPAQGKRRVAVAVPLRAIAKVSPPPRLADVVDASPAPWREPLSQLVRRARAIRTEFTVFGSLAWQFLTGLRYVTNGSDLDLCWRAASREQLDAACRLLASWQRVSGIAVDGEIGFGDDLAVAWREWQGRHAHARVLVKGLHGPALMAAADLLATCEAPSPAGVRTQRTA